MPGCYNHVSTLQNSGKNRPTAGYTLAGTALGVTGDGVYMEGSERGQPKLRATTRGTLTCGSTWVIRAVLRHMEGGVGSPRL